MSDATESTDLGMIYRADFDRGTGRCQITSTPILKVTSRIFKVERGPASCYKVQLIVGQDRIAHTPATAVLAAIDEADGEIARLEAELALKRRAKAALERLFEEVRGSMEGLEDDGC